MKKVVICFYLLPPEYDGGRPRVTRECLGVFDSAITARNHAAAFHDAYSPTLRHEHFFLEGEHFTDQDIVDPSMA